MTADSTFESDAGPLACFDGLPPTLSWREKVAFVAARLMVAPPDELPAIEHVFSDKVYIRKMRLPAGRAFIGRAHRYGHECELFSGSLMLIADGYKQRMDAPKCMVTTPGFHAVFFTLSDIEAWTVHSNPDNCLDMKALELDIFEPVEALTQLGRDLSRRLLS